MAQMVLMLIAYLAIFVAAVLRAAVVSASVALANAPTLGATALASAPAGLAILPVATARILVVVLALFSCAAREVSVAVVLTAHVVADARVTLADTQFSVAPTTLKASVLLVAPEPLAVVVAHMGPASVADARARAAPAVGVKTALMVAVYQIVLPAQVVAGAQVAPKIKFVLTGFVVAIHV